MKRYRRSSDRKLDAAAVRQLALIGGLDLSEDRAESLLPILDSLIAADDRLRVLDLGNSAATGNPWGTTSAE